MKTWQVIVKWIAVITAIILAVSIISSLCTLALSLSFLSGGNRAADRDMSEYSVDGDIKSLEIDIGAGELLIQKGDSFKVVSNNNFLSVKQRGERLIIEEQRRFFSNNKDIVIELTVPEDTVFNKADLSAGGGRVVIEELLADDIELSLGAGDIKIDKLVALERCDIAGGTGEIKIKKADISNLDLETGVGSFDLTAVLSGRNNIEQGVGNLMLELEGSEEDYLIDIDSGLGSVKYNGESVADDAVFGNGESRVNIDAGVGNIKISYTE
ncbi:MAG: DUF4097 domain-containing protein [Ruminococcaceae bacterium]|nr:DUF4097 domain-containing protein [Oscillospiraceae bacterium]